LNQQAELKKAIREEALRRRGSIPGAVRRAKDRALAERLLCLDEYRKAGRVLLYAAFRTEAATEEIIEAAIRSGREVVLPRVDAENGALTKHVIGGLHELSPGYRGIPEPTSEARVKVEEVDLVVVPGVAFDPSGRRLGYGGGYYDRLLPRIKGVKPVVALAYEEQLFESLPGEEHDVGVDIIVTDRRVIRCHGQRED